MVQRNGLENDQKIVILKILYFQFKILEKQIKI